jgi:hypothetical protein
MGGEERERERGPSQRVRKIDHCTWHLMTTPSDPDASFPNPYCSEFK